MNGASATQLAETLSRMIEQTVLKQRRGTYQGAEPTWEEGDEIIISQTDHETNRGAWIRLAERQGFVIKEWPVTPIKGQAETNPYAVELALEGLEPLITPRTRLVAFSACSNVLGGFTPVGGAAKLVKEKTQGRAWVAVDAVAFAPHRQVLPREWGVDFVLMSWYKCFMAHMGSLYISPRASQQLLTKLNHHFLHEYPGTYPFQPSSQQYELIASVAPVVEYLTWIAQASGQSVSAPKSIAWKSVAGNKASSGGAYSNGSANGDGAAASNSSAVAGTQQQHQQSNGTSENGIRDALFSHLARSFQAIAAHEQALMEVLLGFLTSPEMRARGVRVVGDERADAQRRAPTVAFVVRESADGAHKAIRSKDLHARMVQSGEFGAQQGHMYAHALIVKGLGLDVDDGVVRFSFVHYNSVQEVEAVCKAMKQAIDSM